MTITAAELTVMIHQNGIFESVGKIKKASMIKRLAKLLTVSTATHVCDFHTAQGVTDIQTVEQFMAPLNELFDKTSCTAAEEPVRRYNEKVAAKNGAKHEAKNGTKSETKSGGV